MSKQSVWELVAEGKATTIKLPASAQRAPTRVRILRASKWGHYAGFNPASGKRPRCLATGCQRYLRVDQSFACSDGCAKTVHAELAALESMVRAA